MNTRLARNLVRSPRHFGVACDIVALLFMLLFAAPLAQAQEQYSCTITWHCHDGGARFRRIAEYMVGEMRTNSTVGLEPLQGKPPVHDAKVIWYGTKVCQGCDWDHKPKLFPRFGDVYSDIPGRRQELFYDAWSNIHFGYVGVKAGIQPLVLQGGADTIDAFLHFTFFESDRRWVALGIEMAQRYPPEKLTATLLEQEMLRVSDGLAAAAEIPCGERGVRDIGYGGSGNPLGPGRAPRVMLVGDSITHGKTGDYTWRYRLHEHLRRAGVPFDFVGPFRGPMNPNFPNDVRVPGTYAISGWDDEHDATWGWFVGFEKSVIEEHVRNHAPDLVVVHLGTNDLTWGWNESLDVNGNSLSAMGHMRELIRNARRAKPNLQFVIAKIGATSPLEFRIQPGSYNARLEQLADEMRTPESCIGIADVASQWSRPLDTYDETHPNANGEEIIAKAVADELYARWGYGRPYGNFVRRPQPKAPTGVAVSPVSIRRTDKFTVSWDRVVNPGVWTEYRVEIRTHQRYGFTPVWRAPTTTPNTSFTYDGPALPINGVYHVLVYAEDQYGGKLPSAPTALTVGDYPPPPPKPTNLWLEPSKIGRDGGFIAHWDRVHNPGVWTEYRVRVRTHKAYGDQVVWEQAQTTPNLEFMYDGPRFPVAGVYQVDVVARDPYGQQMASDPVELTVYEDAPEPLPAKNVRVEPGTVWRSDRFKISWDRVPNPKIWTVYKVRVKNHRAYGGALIWESPTSTPDLSMDYTGPALPREGIYHVEVVAIDPRGQSSTSAPVELRATNPPRPPPPTGIQVAPLEPRVGDPLIITWDRVQQPGVWTTYRVEIRFHASVGGAVVWQSPGKTTTLYEIFAGPALPVPGTYGVAVIAEDSFGQPTETVVDLVVRPAGAQP